MKDVLIPGIEDKDCIIKMHSDDEAAAQRKASDQRLATLRRRSDELADEHTTHVSALSLSDSAEPVAEIINRASGKASLRKGGLATAQQ